MNLVDLVNWIARQRSSQENSTKQWQLPLLPSGPGGVGRSCLCYSLTTGGDTTKMELLCQANTPLRMDWMLI